MMLRKRNRLCVMLVAICVLVCVSGITAEAAKKKIKKAKITIPKKTYIYTGKAIKPTVTVKYKKKKLKLRKDYKVSYKNNKKVGTATITIKGCGAYTGSVKKKFSIKHSNKFNDCIDFDQPDALAAFFTLSDEVEDMTVTVNANKQSVTQTGTVDGVKYTFTLVLNKYTGKTSAEQLKTCTSVFWYCYPQMYKRFAVKKTPTTVSLAVENEGYEVACTDGIQVHLHDNWLKQNPTDFDCLTHEFAHVIQTQWDGQYVPSYNEDTYMIERFADYCRYVYAYKDGYYNDATWDLQDRNGEDHYSTANRFWLWVDYKYSTDKVDIMARINVAVNSKKSGYATEKWENGKAAWKSVFSGTAAAGKSLTDLWQEYVENDFSEDSAVVPDYGETSILISKYDVRNVIKKR